MDICRVKFVGDLNYPILCMCWSIIRAGLSMLMTEGITALGGEAQLCGITIARFFFGALSTIQWSSRSPFFMIKDRCGWLPCFQLMLT